MCEDKKPNLRDIFSNLQKPMPVARKLWLIMRNNLRKLLRLNNCCGNPGEPGC